MGATSQSRVVLSEQDFRPIAPDGIVEVEGFTRRLQQDLIDTLPTHGNDLELVIHNITLARSSEHRALLQLGAYSFAATEPPGLADNR